LSILARGRSIKNSVSDYTVPPKIGFSYKFIVNDIVTITRQTHREVGKIRNTVNVSK
jgi:hypothetical protein